METWWYFVVRIATTERRLLKIVRGRWCDGWSKFKFKFERNKRKLQALLDRMKIRKRSSRRKMLIILLVHNNKPKMLVVFFMLEYLLMLELFQIFFSSKSVCDLSPTKIWMPPKYFCKITQEIVEPTNFSAISTKYWLERPCPNLCGFNRFFIGHGTRITLNNGKIGL